MAELIVDISKLKHNIHFVRTLCARHAVELVAVAKGCNAYPPVIQAFQESGIALIGFSRVADASKVEASLQRRPCFISIPSPGQAESVTRYFRSSLNSEKDTIRALADAAERGSRVHGILLMVDIGDLREGVTPEQVLPMARFILELNSPFIEFLGLGATLACCSGTLPDEQNLGLLQDLANETERASGHEIRTVSIGGSVILPWIERGSLPSRINQARMGEAILLGTIPATGERHEALHPDVFVLRGTILEVKEKSSKPTGTLGTDVFGQRLALVDRGPRLRCILDFGMIDTYPKGLTPALKSLEFINSNSDYTIVDATGIDRQLRPGDSFDFYPNYQALIRAFQAPYLRRTVTGV
ncbi:MAG: hypothetical protein AUK55_13940 [Syntrophobacteraceae bacterium CG2_30_61_12]|nr:MAG: hypothetical protein AUK55_13940 [Syntrophobacteraceae bacterium CG2_30_61_12]